MSIDVILWRALWHFQGGILDPVIDFFCIRKAERLMRMGAHEYALDVGYPISSLIKRDRLYGSIARHCVEWGYPEYARETVGKIDDVCTVALVWLTIVLYTDSIEDYSALSAARLKIPTYETGLQAFLTNELLKYQQNSRV